MLPTSSTSSSRSGRGTPQWQQQQSHYPQQSWTPHRPGQPWSGYTPTNRRPGLEPEQPGYEEPNLGWAVNLGSTIQH
eukprot:12377288-Alexandrium_andersonii.AAC.1